ncbi:hypothetical protein EVAR_73538_1 [Eumeta japonica]|uniref:Uncharacterized protein n=1 Tax=Eumeta variegata TaxID=151549 RepID=A0A4C1SGT7_EUMVA|nr:hypothetical protein EVAR_73538_1 [Eumeta japonica]
MGRFRTGTPLVAADAEQKQVNWKKLPLPSSRKAPKATKDSNSKNAATPSSASSATSAIKDGAKRPSLKRHKDSLRECKPLNVLVYAETATSKESAVNTLKEILADNT